MGYGFLAIPGLIFLVSLCSIIKIKKNTIKVEAVCVDVKKQYGCRVSSYRGTYQYRINGKEYTACYGKGSTLKPKKDAPTYVYVNKDNYEKITPKEELQSYYLFIALAILMSAYVVWDEVSSYIQIKNIREAKGV